MIRSKAVVIGLFAASLLAVLSLAIFSGGVLKQGSPGGKPTPSGPESGTTGTNIHFGVVGALPSFPNELREAGVGIVRVGIDWSVTEPTNDSYNWTQLDTMVQSAENAGVELLGYFIYAPQWAKRNPSSNQDICEINNMNDFRQFAKDVAKRYDGSNPALGEMKYIEILNEVTFPNFYEQNPIDTYSDWLINGYGGVKEGNPNAVVLIGAFFDPLDHAGGVLENERVFIDKMLQDYSQYYDIVNFHSYSNYDNGITETAQYVKERMAQFGVNKPMWITETNTMFSYADPDWQNKNARDVVKMYARAFGENVEKVFWFTFVGLPLPAEDSVNGIVPKNVTLGWNVKGSAVYHPRQAYYTYKLMTSKLRGFVSSQKISDKQYKFTFTDNNPVYVLWGSGGSLPSEITGTVKVTDYLGNEQTIGASSVVLSDNPVFITQLT
ncbi:MAG: beta-galactosidase [Candidatus Hadarchaeota archaeon]